MSDSKFQPTKPPDKKWHTICFRVSDSLYTRLVEQAKDAKLTPSELTRQMVLYCLEGIEDGSK
jgi:hypothetical protein